MANIFNSVQKGKIKRSKFNLSEEMKLSCNFGQIIPICMRETLPGDRFKISTELLVKFAPLNAPVMHRIKAKVDYFYVPTFQLSDVFEQFINPKMNVAESPIILPYFTPTEIVNELGDEYMKISSLADYLGLPVTQESWKYNSEQPLTVFPFMAYQHIYNSYFRDQNAEPLPAEGGPAVDENPLFDISSFKGPEYAGEWNVDTIGESQLSNLFKLRTSAWKKDYFTSALPTPQAGDDVMLPISAGVNIVNDGDFEFQKDSLGPGNIWYGDVGIGNPDMAPDDDDPSNKWYARITGVTDSEEEEPVLHRLKYGKGLKGEPIDAGISINNLRKMFSLQRFKELAERGGTRYIEILRNFWHETAPDLYFDRPMYLGGSVQPINIGEVLQTSQTTTGDTGSAQGRRAGVANSYGKTKTVSFKARFHGYLVGVLRILPEATYQQGVERMWTRQSIFDYAWPQFANLGEQEIFNREIFANGDENDNKIFGYTPRYAEYKESHCHVAGEFRNNLAYWHFGRVFENLPQLNKTFLHMDNPSYQPFNVQDPSVEHCYVDLYNTIYVKRSLPYFGTPSNL